LQGELTAEGRDVVIFGVNDVGHELGNDAITDGRDLPWLQNTPEEDAWALWGVSYRDVVVIEPDGTFVDVLNLSDNDLADPANLDWVRQRLTE
jgi:hypothetical protein